jgi:hypothetical protein
MNMEHLLAATKKVVELNNQLTAVIEQRDRLAEVLINCMPFISGEGCGEYSDAKEALQSLNQPTKP